MNERITRRRFLGGALAVGAAGLLAGGSSRAPWTRADKTSAPRPASPAVSSSATSRSDERLAALIDASRDERGAAHIERAAFIEADGRVSGSLTISAAEATTLRRELDAGAREVLARDGLRVGGRKLVFLREDENGAVIHAARPGEFVTLRRAAGVVVLASSGAGMVHGRAVDAVSRFVAGRPFSRLQA